MQDDDAVRASELIPWEQRTPFWHSCLVTKHFAVAAMTVAMLTCAGNSASVSVPVEK